MSVHTARPLLHFGDPCVHCDARHDDVAPGPCTGDPGRAVPIAYRSLGVRWDNMERFLVRMSDGRVTERYHHISEGAPCLHFGWSNTLIAPPRHDETLTI